MDIEVVKRAFERGVPVEMRHPIWPEGTIANVSSSSDFDLPGLEYRVQPGWVAFGAHSGYAVSNSQDLFYNDLFCTYHWFATSGEAAKFCAEKNGGSGGSGTVRELQHRLDWMKTEPARVRAALSDVAKERDAMRAQLSRVRAEAETLLAERNKARAECEEQRRLKQLSYASAGAVAKERDAAVKALEEAKQRVLQNLGLA